jgi:hypothetical protein
MPTTTVSLFSRRPAPKNVRFHIHGVFQEQSIMSHQFSLPKKKRAHVCVAYGSYTPVLEDHQAPLTSWISNSIRHWSLTSIDYCSVLKRRPGQMVICFLLLANASRFNFLISTDLWLKRPLVLVCLCVC